MTYQEVLEQARTCMGKCHACPVCNGLACKNTVPGPGAKGLGTGAIRNYQKWQELCVNMDTICENGDVDTSYDFFGHKLTIPVMAGPVGAVAMHYSDKYDDLRYNNVLVEGCAKAGILAFTGDGTNPAVMEGAADALKANGGCGVPTVKPWNLETVRQKMDLVKAADPCAIAMDIDAAGLPFLKGMTPPAGSKTVDQLKDIAAMAGKPLSGSFGAGPDLHGQMPRLPCVQRPRLQKHGPRSRCQGSGHRRHPQLPEMAGAVRQYGHHLRKR